jgi:amino acid transporter
LIPRFGFLASLLFKVLRAILFISAGLMILRYTREKAPEGRNLAGWSLVAWGVYLVLFAFWRVDRLLHLAFGFLVGFQILAALGLVVMVVDRIRIRAEESEKFAKRLEGLLPICSFCKRIRDEDDEWHSVETYIEERSQTEFSHGICPECAKKNYAEVLK